MRGGQIDDALRREGDDDAADDEEDVDADGSEILEVAEAALNGLPGTQGLGEVEGVGVDDQARRDSP
jgi:hypothetical protein